MHRATSPHGSSNSCSKKAIRSRPPFATPVSFPLSLSINFHLFQSMYLGLHFILHRLKLKLCDIYVSVTSTYCWLSNSNGEKDYSSEHYLWRCLAFYRVICSYNDEIAHFWAPHLDKIKGDYDNLSTLILMNWLKVLLHLIFEIVNHMFLSIYVTSN